MSKNMAKAAMVRLLIPAGKAAPTPPVGPALGARGVKSMDFCKEFNAKTAHIAQGVPVPTVITVQPDRTFTFAPANLATRSLGPVSLKHVYEIAKIKASDEHMRHIPLESVARMVVGSARSLGVKVVP
ncbi:mitochondrial 54S ribosomal protein YmL19 [Mycena metata]|uniref:Mitochondrial 54S ribosomal protein YmL19 n=1 Tax=Mycena metata TaxID=1033252 RepID=A0AAD7NYV5_9AGAR|nr:mitochondrial 54S ribosomal protein YmL19 [Mycena metata]